MTNLLLTHAGQGGRADRSAGRQHRSAGHMMRVVPVALAIAVLRRRSTLVGRALADAVKAGESARSHALIRTRPT